MGTDVSGGNNASILNAIRDALSVSQHLKLIKTQDIKGTGKVSPSKTNEEYVPLNYKQVTYLATLGGAKALFLDDLVGNFVVGKRFDGLLIDIDSDPIDSFDLLNKENDEETLLKRLQKFVYSGDDRNIVKVFVDGKQVKILWGRIVNIKVFYLIKKLLNLNDSRLIKLCSRITRLIFF